MLAHLEFSIDVKPDADLVLSGEPFDVTVRTTGADGKPLGVKLAIKVVQQQGDLLAHPVLSQIPWLEGEGTAEPGGSDYSGTSPPNRHRIGSRYNSVDTYQKRNIYRSCEWGGSVWSARYRRQPRPHFRRERRDQTAYLRRTHENGSRCLPKRFASTRV